LYRLGFIIQSVLRTSRAINKVSSMSVYEIMEAESFSQKENTVYKKIRGYERYGYIGRGLREGHAVTFYITPEGCEFLEKEKKGEQDYEK